MFDKLKKMFSEKDEKKKMENLVAFLIILVITLIVINKILSKDTKKEDVSNSTNVELVDEVKQQAVPVSTEEESLKEELEDILSGITGVGKVKVLLTYAESKSISPLYNESVSSSTSTDSNGTTTETKTENKDIFTSSNNEAVIQKSISPKLEGAIVIAEGAGDATVKENIINAVGAVTGLLSHKVQVFEMDKN